MHFTTRCLAALVLLSGTAFAQQKGADPAKDYPNKPIRWLIDFGAGGLSDTLARIVGQKLTEAWNQPIINEARPGVNGTIANDIGAKAVPDGYTLVFVSTPFSINISVYDKLPFDTRRDFAPISLIAMYPNILVAGPNFPAKTVSELIAYSKSKPGGPTWATVGAGSSPYLATELFLYMADVKMNHIPYKGTGPALTDTIAGQIQLSWASTPGSVTFVKSGKLKALAVTSVKRIAPLPETATVAESGLPGYEASVWYGVAAPARTPVEVVNRLNAEIVKVLADRANHDKIASADFEPTSSSPAEFAKFIRSEHAKWAKVVKESGAKVD